MSLNRAIYKAKKHRINIALTLENMPFCGATSDAYPLRPRVHPARVCTYRLLNLLSCHIRDFSDALLSNRGAAT